MNGGSLSSLVGRLREAVRPADAEALGDAELLRRWLAARDEAAFELLVWRHGRLVLSACRRLLRRPQDVEDAFQATFLVLVRRAASISRRQALASWLHTVAVRIASHARARAARAENREAVELDDLPGAEEPAPDSDDLRRVLDEEVARLPEKYRVPFVLCHLEGRTNEDAARELGCPLGTVLSRLSRARERLRGRLTRRGLAPSGLVAGVSLAGEAVSPALVASTAKAALLAAAGRSAAGAVSALAEGALHAMFIAKMKTSLAIVLTVAVVGVGGGFGYRAVSAQDGNGGAKTSDGLATKGGDDRGADTQELLKVVEQLKRELQQTQDRAERLKAQLTRVQDQLGMRRTNPPTKGKVRDGLTGDTKGGPTGPGPNPALEDEKDRIELLRARLSAKEADLNASKAMLEESKHRYGAAARSAERNPGAINSDDLAASKVTVQKYRAEVQAKEAELLEAQILLKQAERQLGRRLGWFADVTAPSRSLEQRVAELERQVADLLKERLIRESQRGRAGSGPPK
jgi:RNA polymerase sigma-70 factor (ECF subfamily)